MDPTRSIEDCLADLVGPSRERAEVAFSELMVQSRPRLETWLQPFIRNADDREDLIQEAWIRVWKSRETFEIRGTNYWWAYLKQISTRCGIDHFRSNSPELPDDPGNIDRIADPDMEAVMAMLDYLTDRDRLYALADEVWLGVRPPDHARRVLAAKLFYLDGLSWSEISQLLAKGFPGREALKRYELDEWLADRVLVRYLACQALYMPNAPLAYHILDIDPRGDESFDELVEMAMRAKPSAGAAVWTKDEVYVILWRYKYGKLIDQIGHLPGCRLKKEEMRSLFDRCREKFPFLSVMRELKGILDQTPATKGIMMQSQIWKRLVFQYFAADELPQKDILERTSPAAEHVGYSLTPGMLNVWLSNGRLLKQLVQHAMNSGDL